MVANTNQDRQRRMFMLFGQAVELIQKYKRSPEQIDALLKALQLFKDQPSDNVYKVIIDYSKSLAEMISLGKYGLISNGNINDEHFHIQGTGINEIELLLVKEKETGIKNFKASTPFVLEQLDEEGLMPAKIEHLLALGAAYPEIQRKFQIFSLGSVWDYNPHGMHLHYYPYLGCYEGKRELTLGSYDDCNHWPESSRFLAIPK